MAGKVSKTLEKYGTIAQHQLAIRQSGFFGFVTTKILNRFLMIAYRNLVFKFACYMMQNLTDNGEASS
jgi:hypothetical protein